MPCPHYRIKISSRSKGQSAVAQAAYQSGERLFDERSHRTKFYSEKRGIVYTEILLPENAPREYADRSTLWNAVEEAEPNWNAQLARRFEIALPVELTPDQRIALLREHCLTQFVAKGMIADIAIHDPDPPGHNPHAHVMLTMRPMDAQGHWMPKAHREYELDEGGNRIRDANGKWKFRKVFTTDWDDRDNCEKWRHEWELLQNQYLEAAGRPERICMMSYERQGVEQIPTVHMGAAVTAMERRGIRTNIGNLNREIRRTNLLIARLKRSIRALLSWLAEIKDAIREIEAEPKEVLLVDLLVQRFNERKDERQSWNNPYGANAAAGKDLKRFAQITNYLRENNILTVADLDARFAEINKANQPIQSQIKQVASRAKIVEKLIEYGEQCKKLDPIHEEYLRIHWKGKKEKYEAAHHAELEAWKKADRYLRKNLPEQPYRKSSLQKELASLQASLEELNTQLAPGRDEIQMLKDIRYFVKDLLPELIPEGDALTSEHREEKKRSILERLAEAEKQKQEYEAARQQGQQPDRRTER